MTSGLRLTAVVLCALASQSRSAHAAAAWELAGPFGGSAQAIAIDPRSPNVLLAGAQNTLLFRSEDAGESWRLLPFPRHYAGTVQALTIDPEDARYWAGIASEDPSVAGLWESRDSGQHWLRVPALAGVSVESLALCPVNPRVMAAGTRRGVYLTADHGVTWKRVTPAENLELADITVVRFNPADPAVLYAGTPHLPWRTTDGGLHWSPIHNGMVDDSDVFAIFVDANRPRTVFASACSGVYRSNDGGDNWHRMKILGGDFRTHAIVQDAGNPETVFAGTTAGLFRSLDGGTTWRRVSGLSVSSLVFDPSHPHTLYLAAQQAGLLKSSDGGDTFRSVNRGFVNRQIAGITAVGNELFANGSGEGESGGLFATGDGREWTRRSGGGAFPGGSVQAIAGTSQPDLLFAATGREVQKSSDGGRNWVTLQTQPGRRHGEDARPPALQALDAWVRDGHAALLAGSDSGLFYCAAEGREWQEIAIAGRSRLDIRSIHRSASQPGEIAVSTPEGLFLSQDAGHTWSQVPLPARGYAVYDVAFGGAGEPIFVATSHGLFRYPDGVTRWENPELPAETVTAVRYGPNRRGVVFAAQYGRVYQSSDSGQTWTLLPVRGLEGSAVDRLWQSARMPDRLFAVVQGLGIVYLDLAGTAIEDQRAAGRGSRETR